MAKAFHKRLVGQLSGIQRRALCIMKKLNPNRLLPKVEDGYGRYGGLTYSLDKNLVQCHICGKFFESLGLHVRQIHGLLSRDYKAKFQLAKMSSLNGEALQEKMRRSTRNFFADLTPRKRAAFVRLSVKNRQKNKTFGNNFTISLETKIKRGHAPEQLLENLSLVVKKLGHSPSIVEFIDACGSRSQFHLICKEFGSLRKALKKLGLEPAIRGGKREGPYRWDSRTLLLFIQLFVKSRNRLPTLLDCKRGLIPGQDAYRAHFGSLDKARELSGVYKIIPKDQIGRWKKIPGSSKR